MTVLGKVYLGVSLTLLVLGVVWASSTLQANAAWVEIVLAVPRADLIEPLSSVRYQVNLAALLAGWVVAVGLIAFAAIRAPFKIRGVALARRRIKELEREVLTLRRLPLRQQEEDEALAEEAQLEDGTKKVMTETLNRSEVAPLTPDGNARADGNRGRDSR